MTVFSAGPVPQPENPLAYEEYKTLIQGYYRLRKEYYSLSYGHQPDRERKDFVQSLIEHLRSEYWSRLPNYLLARCPICGGRVWEPVDTYSLNGIGWLRAWEQTGDGWRGRFGKPSYETECKHTVIVEYGVNLNGLVPDDVFTDKRVAIGSERPGVMAKVLAVDQTYAVVHALPMGRYDDPELLHRYTIYFVTYFTERLGGVLVALPPAHEGCTHRLTLGAEYDLVKWVKAGRLFWLDPDDPELPLRNEPAEAFPYANVQGREGRRCEIVGGKLVGGWEPLSKTVCDFLKGLFGRKD